MKVSSQSLAKQALSIFSFDRHSAFDILYT